VAEKLKQSRQKTISFHTQMAHKISKLGWIPDHPDQRDLIYAAPRPVISKLPSKADLRKTCPPVYDQGELGSCTANAIGAAFEFELIKQNPDTAFTPSRLFIYYNERVMENSVNSDSGAMIRDGMKSANKQGVCPEKMWPYDAIKFASRAPASCYTNALGHQVLSYHRIPRNLNQMKGCIAEGFPFVIGFSVYESFESAAVAKLGVLNLPKKDEIKIGGHAVMIVGFDDKSQRFIARNSWGLQWGQKGYFTIPYAYLTDANLSDDFWTIRIVEAAMDAKKKRNKLTPQTTIAEKVWIPGKPERMSVRIRI
jgi:C1A family cysteine protease